MVWTWCLNLYSCIAVSVEVQVRSTRVGAEVGARAAMMAEAMEEAAGAGVEVEVVWAEVLAGGELLGEEAVETLFHCCQGEVSD